MREAGKEDKEKKRRKTGESERCINRETERIKMKKREERIGDCKREECEREEYTGERSLRERRGKMMDREEIEMSGERRGKVKDREENEKEESQV